MMSACILRRNVFNGISDTDFRVESDSSTHALFVDASQSYVGVNTSSLDIMFEVGMSPTSNITNNTQTTLGNFGGSSRMGFPGLGSNNDGVYFGMEAIPAGIGFMREASGWDTQMRFYTNSITSGPDGTNAMQEKLRIGSTSTVFNETGRDHDFRVESDGNANAFLIDAGEDLAAFAVPTSLYNGSAGNSPSLIFGGETEAGPQKSIYLDTYYMVHQIHVNEGLKFRFTSGTTASFDDRHLIKNGEVVFNETSNDSDFRVESDNNTHALFVDASNGLVNINTTDTSVANNTGSARGINLGFGYIESAAYQDTVLYLNRMNNDGTIVDLRQNGSTEGTISVSGSTVSYNGFAGRHESSGIPTTTARGTVVSTIDELDEYLSGTKQGQTRADHAKVKVSDSVGDARVYGVVDDFDENDKLFVVSVGIASVKVTGSCSGGDLLESNGDGTAKVQSDDIVRSKTIGKVTIGNSDTGVKLVSCVLYCG